MSSTTSESSSSSPPPPPSMSKSSSSLLDSLILSRVPVAETIRAIQTIHDYAVRTPLIKLNYKRHDNPELEIYLKLETLQPINSFKLRGAIHKIKSTIQSCDNNNPFKDKYGTTIVSASAGNMGQGVAYAAKIIGLQCIVIVPHTAPQTKLDAMINLYNAKIIKVPYERWWEIIETGNVTKELSNMKHLFIHPVCDPLVIAGNSTIGYEIIQDLPDVDAIFCSWGGGGCASGIGSVIKNIQDNPSCYDDTNTNTNTNTTETENQQHHYRHRSTVIDMISVEPATAAPLCYSFNNSNNDNNDNNKPIIPLPNSDPTNPNAYKSSWIDGCGGKAVLKPMWEVAKDVLTDAYKVELNAVERALQILVERNRIVAEGAGACTVAAAMYGPIKQKHWKKVVAVVTGGCIDTKVLTRILNNTTIKNSNYIPSSGFSFTQPITSMKENSNDDKQQQQQQQQHLTKKTDDHNHLKVISSNEVRKFLPMKECMEAMEQAFIARSNGTDGMPLRQVIKLPFPTNKTKVGFLASMPSYTTGVDGSSDSSGDNYCSNDDWVSCKCISVFPQNSSSSSSSSQNNKDKDNNNKKQQQFSSHQGVVLLWNKGGNGELVLIVDAHEVTKIRTAAASAVATRTILGKQYCNENVQIISILGTGDQAKSHIEAMIILFPKLTTIQIWGRNIYKANQLKDYVIESILPTTTTTTNNNNNTITVSVHDSVASCITNTDVICTVTAATSPILTNEHLNLLLEKRNCHINAVGSCTPIFHELDPTIYEKSVKGNTINKIFTDSIEACMKEPGEILAYLEKTKTTTTSEKEKNDEKGSSSSSSSSSSLPQQQFVEIGNILTGKVDETIKACCSSNATSTDSNVIEKPMIKGLTIFKSLGIALEDLYAAKLIYERIQKTD